ncbi:hypothetical protein cypCar_00014397, partial [Cyprinus carpio]
GVTDYLSAEISTSKQKKFSLVTFVDTPGLVDGDMVYPFDVNSAITSFGEQADLIFVFFDPMGQALCKRTLNIVEKLSEKCGDKLRFYLSKADERVMMQIVQELCRRPGLNKCGFEMPTIYIPNPQKPSRCINQIDEVCETIEKSINQAVQKTLDQLEKDCNLIISTINHTLEQDRMNVSSNKSNRFNSFLCGVVGIFLPSLFILSFIISTFAPEDLDSLIGEGLAKTLYFSTGIVVYLWDWIPEDWQIMFVIIFGALCYFMFFLAKYFARSGLSAVVLLCGLGMTRHHFFTFGLFPMRLDPQYLFHLTGRATSECHHNQIDEVCETIGEEHNQAECNTNTLTSEEKRLNLISLTINHTLEQDPGSKTLSKREKKKLAEYSDYIQDIVKSKKRKLYEEYLRQCAAEYDF